MAKMPERTSSPKARAKQKSKAQLMGYEQALDLTLKTVAPLSAHHIVRLDQSLGRVLFNDIFSKVNSPSINASMKDGYAVRSDDISYATPKNNVSLKIIGISAAGVPTDQKVTPGCTVRILTGGKIPVGANAVLSDEFTILKEERIAAVNTAEPGRNILPKGADVQIGELILKKGSCLTPGMIGILAAAGLAELPVYPKLKVAILATGDELVAPGQPLADGKLYASNLEMLKMWCMRFRMPVTSFILKDRSDLITQKIRELIVAHDALITSGGAWTGDRDYVADTLASLGWKKVFHRIRIGPGKPVGLGMLNQKPVFLLPGGPPSNLTGFLKIALPGLLRLGGHRTPSLPEIMVTLEEEIVGRQIDWTQFIYGRLKIVNGQTLFKPLKLTSRLKSMAKAQGVIAIPEGVKSLPAGANVCAQIFL